MSRLSPRFTPLLLPVAALGAAAAITGCGSGSSGDNASAAQNPKATTAAVKPAAVKPAAAALPSAVSVKLSEWSITPSVATAKAGKITFTVTNTGKMGHEMVVLKTDAPAGKLPVGSNSRVSEATNVGEAGDVPVGKTKTVTLNLKPGHYQLVCNIAGHYKAGMTTDFTVA